MRGLVGTLGVCVLAVMVAPAAWATTLDLTTGVGATGSINDAIFTAAVIQPAGTGVIDSFVRIQNSPTEQGYNTSGRPVPFDELTDPNFTRNLLLAEIPTVTNNGIDYLQFGLDINEPEGNGAEFLSLDEVKIFTSTVGSQTTTNVDSLGNLVYDMDGPPDGDSTVLLSAAVVDKGSGASDMELLVPKSLFSGAAQTDFVYLYSHFGDVGVVTDFDSVDTADFGSADGFEEWFVQQNIPPAIPEPMTMALLGLSLAAVGAKLRKRLTRA